jgi:PIN like domain
VKVLLDENIPAPVTSTVKTLLRRSHDVQHVIDMPGWSGTKDLHLYGKAKEGYPKLSLKKYKPIAARNEDVNVSRGLL